MSDPTPGDAPPPPSPAPNPPAPAGTPQAFRTQRGRSVMDALHGKRDTGASISLRGVEDDPAPVTVQRTGEAAAGDDSHYQILGEIARGGIGIVYRARDKDLNRDIAIKVLREEFVQRRDVVQRFIEEAQVGGQLQHPGIVPIYGLSLQSDGRPSFAMKLIKGQTLAELLESNPRGIDLISVFEQIAQTIAFAHSRRVIHRDLKPANVMVGAFGEVQVVDWGFAKVLGQEETHRAPDRSVIATVRSAGEGSHSLAGSVMGTPAYMPPEQAMGSIADLDERCDVFSLGAILLEIFTGKAPYTGTSKDQLIAAAQCRLQPAHERLGAADAPEGLKQIVRDCLQPLPGDRPKNARVVAERLSGYLASVQDRVRQAELDALASEARSKRERAARKRTLVLTGVVALLVLVGGGAYFLWKRDRDERHARAEPSVAGALREAVRHEQTESWQAAVAAAQRALDIAVSEGVDDARARLTLARLKGRHEAEESAARLRSEDDALLAELVAIRNLAPGSAPVAHATEAATQDPSKRTAWRHTGDRSAGMDAAYEAAFAKRFGSVAASRDRLKASRHAPDFAANLWHWCMLRKTSEVLRGSDWAALDALARQVDPGNEDIRDALLARDRDALLLAVERRGDMLPLALVSQVAATLIDIGHPKDAIDFLLPWNRRHPEEMMIHLGLAQAARQLALAEGRPDLLEVAARHATAAVALRPEVDLGWHNLGLCLASAGELDRAIVAFERVIALTPGYLAVYDHLAEAQLLAQRPEQALAAVARALEIAPNDAALLLRRGSILSEHLGKHAEALATYRAILEEHPQEWAAYTSMAVAEVRKGDTAAARGALLQALSLEPDSSRLNAEVAHVYLELHDLDGAVRHGKKAVASDPTSYAAHLDLGRALELQGQTDAAVAAYRRAIDLPPPRSEPFVQLGGIHLRRAEIETALECAQRAVEISPGSASAQACLAAALLGSGYPEGAREAAERGIELDPNVALNHVYLGAILAAQNDLAGALESCRRGVDLAPTLPEAHRMLAFVHAQRGDRFAALAAFKRSVDLGDQAPATRLRNHMGQAQLLEQLEDWPEALAEYEKAALLDPGFPPAHSQVGILRLRQKDYAGALLALAKRAELGPTDAQAQALLAYAHWLKGDVDAAAAAAVKAVDLGAKDTFTLGLHGEVLLHQGHVAQAVESLQKAVVAIHGAAFCRDCMRYHPAEASPHAHFLLGEACAQDGRVEEAVAAYRQSLSLRPTFEPAFTGLARALASRGERLAAVGMYRRSVQLAPTKADVRALFGLQLASLAEFEEALEVLSKAAEADAQHGAALEDVRRRAALAPRLEAVLAGEDKPTAAEVLDFAQLARSRREYEGAVRLFDQALGAAPPPATEPKRRVYAEAAYAAAQTGEAGRSKALAWLRADLAACAAMLPAARAYLRASLPCLLVHVDLAPVREADDLPAEWSRYWADLEALIARVREAD